MLEVQHDLCGCGYFTHRRARGVRTTTSELWACFGPFLGFARKIFDGGTEAKLEYTGFKYLSEVVCGVCFYQ